MLQHSDNASSKVGLREEQFGWPAAMVSTWKEGNMIAKLLSKGDMFISSWPFRVRSPLIKWLWLTGKVRMEPTPKIDKLNEENICMSNKLIVKDIDTRQKLFIASGGPKSRVFGKNAESQQQQQLYCSQFTGILPGSVTNICSLTAKQDWQNLAWKANPDSIQIGFSGFVSAPAGLPESSAA